MANLVSRGRRGGPGGPKRRLWCSDHPQSSSSSQTGSARRERAGPRPPRPGAPTRRPVSAPRPAPPTYASSGPPSATAASRCQLALGGQQGPPPRPSLASSPLCARLLTCPNLPSGSACSLATWLAAGPGPRGGMVLGLKKQHKPTVHAAEGAGRLAPREVGGVLGGSGARTQHGQTGKNKTKTEPKPTTTTTTGRLQK